MSATESQHKQITIPSQGHTLLGYAKNGLVKGVTPLPQFFGTSTTAPLADGESFKQVLPFNARLIDFVIIGDGQIHQRTLANFPEELSRSAKIGEIFFKGHLLEFKAGSGGIKFAFAVFEEIDLQQLPISV